MKKFLVILMTSFVICGCSSTKTYENTTFPTGNWHPVNPEYFGQSDAQRITEGKSAESNDQGMENK